MAKTNINKGHRHAFNALTSGKYDNFALFSCFINNKPGCAIVAIDKPGNDYQITPLFVSVTKDMTLTDHDNNTLNF